MAIQLFEQEIGKVGCAFCCLGVFLTFSNVLILYSTGISPVSPRKSRLGCVLSLLAAHRMAFIIQSIRFKSKGSTDQTGLPSARLLFAFAARS
jgi:hypothetical protein